MSTQKKERKEITSIFKTFRMYMDDGQVVVESFKIDDGKPAIVALFHLYQVKELLQEY